MNRHVYWILWIILTLGLGGYYARAFTGPDQTALLPGETSSGHYQFEIRCKDCHGEGFSGPESLQKACVRCHGKELKAVDDSHPRSKFTDPRNADRVAQLDARVCITCHREHTPGITDNMGVTLPEDFCALCHQDITEDRPSHRDMGFDTCADAGCHNYHDNKALYEDFLVKHGNEADLKDLAELPARDLGEHYRKLGKTPLRPLKLTQQDAPVSVRDAEIAGHWSVSAHAAAGINCLDCHRGDGATWVQKPGPEHCADCHDRESASFRQGRHGMRLDRQLPALRPAAARAPLRKDPAHDSLDCMSCHDDHRFDTRRAAAEACLGCHDDEHSRAWRKSRHFTLWQQQRPGGVSCAGCHMPRTRIHDQGLERTLVVHNQNLNLRPNEKMIRSVCMHCHGLGFSLDALADAGLVDSNFNGPPSVRVDSIAMALAREKDKQQNGESH